MKAVLGALAAVFIASTAVAQPALPTCKPPDPNKPTPPESRTYQDLWCANILEIADARRGLNGTSQDAGRAAERIGEAVAVRTSNWRAFLLYAQARSGAVDASPVEDARTDKQVGAPAGAGSTSIVSKGAVPGILGFAVENGALTQTTSDTTITLRGNAVGWLDLLKNQEFIASYQDGSSFVRALRSVVLLDAQLGHAAGDGRARIFRRATVDTGGHSEAARQGAPATGRLLGARGALGSTRSEDGPESSGDCDVFRRVAG